ncbi:potassium channel family protein [Streptomyces sp. NPDC012637]|uniref:potassium channel family protein n=1 Tax=Streptomyces sp. NPDC012637 TaxID=3364842 RepID=UPI0036E9C774
MTWVLTLVGAALILFILRDVFHTLWHPTRHGGLSRLVMRSVWRLSAHHGERRRPAGLAGPTGMMAVVAAWSLTVAVGWGLLYWPRMPEDFSYASGLAPGEHAGPVDALYVSLVTLATLGLGDIAPTSGWLRVLAPLEALVGFALLSATVAWILGIYPALARRRALALRLSHVRRAQMDDGALDSAGGAALLDGLASALSTVTVDFEQYPESYYFYDIDEHTSLPAQLDHAVGLADRAARARHPDVRLSASVLRTALQDLSEVLDERFTRTGADPGRVFAAYAADHGRS